MSKCRNVQSVAAICVRTTEDTVRCLLQRYLKDRCGATGVEYGIIGAFLSIAIYAGASLIGAKILNVLASVPAYFH